MSDADRGDIIAHSSPEAAAAARYAAYPGWLRDRLEWFQDLKFGLILHFGIYSQWDCYESWPLVPADTWARPDDLRCWNEHGRDLERFSAAYRALNQTFNPVAFNPEAWADLAAEAGFRYVCMTTKHHDGFCLWDTRTTDYRVTHPSCPFASHPRADIIRGVFDAFRARQMAISCYFSKSDWHQPAYWRPDRPIVDRNPNYDTLAEPAVWRQFVEYVHAQVGELMTGYGPIDILWLDGGQVRPPNQDIDMDRLAAEARAAQPGLIIADRTVGGEHENFITPEQEVPDQPLGFPWESCITLGNGWKYNPGSMVYRPAEAAIRQLVDVVAKGGNLLLGIGPTPEGIIDDVAAGLLREIGAWLAVNGEAIYGSRAIAPYREEQTCYTQRDGRVYALVMDGDPPLRQVALRGQQPADGSPVRLLGHDGLLPWRRDDGATLVDLPERRPRAVGWVLVIEQPAG